MYYPWYLHWLIVIIPVTPYILHAGVARALFRATFNIGKKNYMNAGTSEMLRNLNTSLSATRLPGEFSHRSRTVKLGVTKAAEWRTLFVLLFPLVMSALTGKPKCQRLWLLGAFLVRASLLPDLEYLTLDAGVDLQDLHLKWYQMYQRVFNVNKLSYNIHMFLHLPLIRRGGPLTGMSAFCFESSYATLRRSFTPGTTSTGQQALLNYLGRLDKTHVCERTIWFHKKTTRMRDDKYVMYMEKPMRLLAQIDRHSYKAVELKVKPYKNSLYPSLPWEDVGVYRVLRQLPTVTIVDTRQVTAKLVLLRPPGKNRLLVTASLDLLRE